MALLDSDLSFGLVQPPTPPRPRQRPLSGIARSRKTLPFPLPDPWSDASSEVYDPHGNFVTRARTSSLNSSAATASDSSGVHSRESSAIDSSPSRLAKVTSVAAGTAGKGAWSFEENNTPPNDALDDSAWVLVANESDSAVEAASPIDIDPVSSPPSQSSYIPPDDSSSARGRWPFNRLRIGSSGSSPNDSSFDFAPLRMNESPSRLSNHSNSPARGSTSEAWSPAASFLSNFSPGADRAGTAGFSSFSALAGDAEGFEIGGYRLGRELGVGGFGVVREATHLDDGAKVAIKIVRREPDETPTTSSFADGLKRSFSGVVRAGNRATPREAVLANERVRSSSSPIRPRLPPFSPSPSISRMQDLSASLSSLPTPPLDSMTPDEPSLRQSLLDREIVLWKQLAPHPHIMPLLSVHHTPEFSYICMPLCTGGNLLSYLTAVGRPTSTAVRGRRLTSMPIAPLSPSSSITAGPKGLPLPACLPIFSQVVSGLHYLHNEAGVTHKDIKLENILCTEPGGAWVITDFGLTESATTSQRLRHGAISDEIDSSRHRHAQSASDRGPVTPGTPLASLSRAGSLSRPDSTTQAISEHLYPAGSLPYSPPEQMKSPIPILDPSVDIWALGCVLYALVSGELPFADEFEPRLRMKIMRGEWVIPAALSISPDTRGDDQDAATKLMVLEVLRGCLEPDPAKRWTIDQVRASEWISGEGARGRSCGRPPLASRSRSSHSSRGSSGQSATRRKERSTSRGLPHYADPRTRDMELHDKEKEERQMRWDRERESRLEGRSRSGGSRTGDDRLARVAEPY